jgi:hypothetical protein
MRSVLRAVELDGFLNAVWADNSRIVRMTPEQKKTVVFIREIRLLSAQSASNVSPGVIDAKH